MGFPVRLTLALFAAALSGREWAVLDVCGVDVGVHVSQGDKKDQLRGERAPRQPTR